MAVLITVPSIRPDFSSDFYEEKTENSYKNYNCLDLDIDNFDSARASRVPIISTIMYLYYAYMPVINNYLFNKLGKPARSMKDKIELLK